MRYLLYISIIGQNIKVYVIGEFSALTINQTMNQLNLTSLHFSFVAVFKSNSLEAENKDTDSVKALR